MAVAAQPSFLGIPPELRKPIYAHLFDGLVYRIKCLYGEKNADVENLKARSAILRSCRQIREEAFSTFNSSVKIINHQIYTQVRELPEVLQGVKQIETPCKVFDLEDLLRKLPQLELITSVVGSCFDDSGYQPFMDLDELPGLLTGEHDNDFINRNILALEVTKSEGPQKMKIKDKIRNVKANLESIKQGPIKLELSHTARCTIVLNEPHPMPYFNEDCNAQANGNDIYRITIDADTQKLVRREINMHDGWEEGEKWVAAEKVVLLDTQYFEHPVLYVPDTGESRILVWQYSNDDMELHDLEEYDPREDFKERISNEYILKRALETATKCVPVPGKERAKPRYTPLPYF